MLAEAEQRFGYERTVEKHPKYQCMTRYLYKVSEGLAETNSTNSVKKVESYAGNLKKGNQLSLELLGKTSSTGSGSSTDQQEVMSDSYKILAEKHKELNSLRSKLRVNSEELELIKTTIASMNDPTWTKKHDEIAKAIEVLQEFLKEVRQQLAEGPSQRQGIRLHREGAASFEDQRAMLPPSQGNEPDHQACQGLDGGLSGR